MTNTRKKGRVKGGAGFTSTLRSRARPALSRASHAVSHASHASHATGSRLFSSEAANGLDENQPTASTTRKPNIPVMPPMMFSTQQIRKMVKEAEEAEEANKKRKTKAIHSIKQTVAAEAEKKGRKRKNNTVKGLKGIVVSQMPIVGKPIQLAMRKQNNLRFENEKKIKETIEKIEKKELNSIGINAENAEKAEDMFIHVKDIFLLRKSNAKHIDVLYEHAGRQLKTSKEFYSKVVDTAQENFKEEGGLDYSLRDFSKLIHVWTPNRLVRFKAAMINLYLYNSVSANSLFYQIIDRFTDITHDMPIRVQQDCIDKLTLTMLNNPEDALEQFGKDFYNIIEQGKKQEKMEKEAQKEAQKEIEKDKRHKEKLEEIEKKLKNSNKSWFARYAIRLLITGTAGITILFLCAYNDIPIFDREKLSQSISNSIKDSKMKNLTLEERTWTQYTMNKLGYNYKKAENTRKFNEDVNNTLKWLGSVSTTIITAAITYTFKGN